jgi:hypothetical protein
MQLYQRPFANRLWAARETRGIGILANEETNLIGWKPMPLFLLLWSSPKARGRWYKRKSEAEF